MVYDCIASGNQSDDIDKWGFTMNGKNGGCIVTVCFIIVAIIAIAAMLQMAGLV
jgi:hypothetical protein